MKLIESSVEIIPQQSGLEGIYKQIELAGRTCYASQNLITENSAERFVRMLQDKGHGSVLEQCGVYFIIHTHGDVELMNKVC